MIIKLLNAIAVIGLVSTVSYAKEASKEELEVKRCNAALLQIANSYQRDAALSEQYKLLENNLKTEIERSKVVAESVSDDAKIRSVLEAGFNLGEFVGRIILTTAIYDELMISKGLPMSEALFADSVMSMCIERSVGEFDREEVLLRLKLADEDFKNFLEMITEILKASTNMLESILRQSTPPINSKAVSA